VGGWQDKRPPLSETDNQSVAIQQQGCEVGWLVGLSSGSRGLKTGTEESTNGAQPHKPLRSFGQLM
jgi:hypothetical protein